ncbi:hypothetical protein VIGAN_09174500 [Vigna angularis var. angularis]|uniref:Uncharacterized protein n=1 Tax=Vigna angularis var. angularis TaxID=157739 RepID=A0A0S3SYV7_PHAAN|nr:hypothetical protein VIGAN_09174500 [Vigna angularis var. angularis]
MRLSFDDFILLEKRLKKAMQEEQGKNSNTEAKPSTENYAERRRRSEDVEACGKKKTDVDGSNGCSGRSKQREGGSMIQRRQWFLGDLSLILGAEI